MCIRSLTPGKPATCHIANKISAGQATIVHLTIKNVQAYDVEGEESGVACEYFVLAFPQINNENNVDSKADSAPRCKLCIIL